MNELNVVIIQPVNNGFIVTIPRTSYNQFNGAVGPVPKTDDLMKTENVFIFDSMEKVLAFLDDKYIQHV